MTNSQQGNDPSSTQQEEMPFAVVQGEPLTVLPKDLYIPPEALEVFLDAFEGPLDLLLYLIKRQNIDILNIPVAEITNQYVNYINMMDSLQLEIAAEYLVMAAMLAEIKSRLLLPRAVEESEEGDPRAELIRRLQDYERFRQAAEDIDAMPRVERDIHLVETELPELERRVALPDVSMQDLLMAMNEVLQRSDMFSHHHIQREPLSVRERMIRVLDKLRSDGVTDFRDLFTAEEGRLGVVVSFLAILELIKESLIDLVQAEAFAPIYIQVAVSSIEAGSIDAAE